MNSFISTSLFPSQLLILGQTLAIFTLLMPPHSPPALTQQSRLQHALMYLELTLNSTTDLHTVVFFLLGFVCRNSELYSLMENIILFL